MRLLNNYILRLAVIILLTVAGASGMKALIYYGINHHSDDHLKFNELFRNKSDYDILLLGASRMRNNINPAIVDSITGHNSYNAGAEAANILESKMIFDAYLLAHPKPKLVVLTLDPASLVIRGQYIGFYPKYLEFKDIPPVAALLRKNRVRVGLYKLFPFLETAEIDDYNRGNVLKVAMHQRKLLPDDFFYKGFESNTAITMPDDDIPCKDMVRIELEDEAKTALEQLVHSCINKGIRVVFIYAPEYKRSIQKCLSNFSELIDYYNSLSTRYNIPFIRYDMLPLNDSGSLFANPPHLNRTGAAIYSKIFAHQIVDDGWLK